MPWVSAARLTLIVLAAMMSIGCGFGKRYEYEEDLYLSTSGSADLIVNASVPALVMLRGFDLSVDPAAMLDRGRLLAAYQSPITEGVRVTRSWRRNGRRFVQIRLRITDLIRLSEVSPLAWSTYELVERNGQIIYRQKVGAAALRPGAMRNVGWRGGELVAFRLHLPSRIIEHNARDVHTQEPAKVERGNIVAWEQPLADRLAGEPVVLEVRMEAQSILHRTLWLFAGAFASAVLVIALLIWLTIRKGAREAAEVH
jgi:hypothetical protein